MRYTTGHDKRLHEARRADALAAELIRTRERCDALADTLRAIIHAYDNGRPSDEFNVALDQAIGRARDLEGD